jgi:anti-anti-sigma factor
MSETAVAPLFSTEIEHPAPHVALVVCHGRLVSRVAEEFYASVRALIPDNERIILDLSDLTHTDSMGLGTLVRLYVATRSAGRNLELMHLSRQIRNLLGLTNLFEVFTVVGEHGVKFM